jgi:hypothetical protein
MRYRFDEVKAALLEHWGLALHRGGELSDMGRDGRWDRAYSRTGFIVLGEMPRGYGCRRYTALAGVVVAWDLEKVIGEARKRAHSERQPQTGDVTADTITDDHIRDLIASTFKRRQNAHLRTIRVDCAAALKGDRSSREAAALHFNRWKDGR